MTSRHAANVRDKRLGDKRLGDKRVRDSGTIPGALESEMSRENAPRYAHIDMIKSTTKAKSTLRRAMRQARAGRSQHEREAASQAICARLWKLLCPPDLRASSTEKAALEADAAQLHRALKCGGAVAVYLATEEEACVDALARQLLARGVRVAAPIVRTGGDNRNGEMAFFAVRDLDSVRSGAFGVREPMFDGDALLPGEIAIYLVPGLAFGPDGARLGQGGGFYDRALAQARESNALFVGVCFSWQVIESVPCEGHDQKVALVVTESDAFFATAAKANN